MIPFSFAHKPMGLITAEDEGTVVPIEGPLPDGVLGEVRCHQQIYKRRNDVNGIARTLPKKRPRRFRRFKEPHGHALGLRVILRRRPRFGTTFCF